MRKSVAKAVRQVRVPFGADQVLAILAGTKDVTRRPVRERLTCFAGDCPRGSDIWRDPTLWGAVLDGDFYGLESGDESDLVLPSKYRTGDLMVMTESHRPVYDRRRDLASIEYRADGWLRTIDDSDLGALIEAACASGKRNWRPARFMRSGFSRLSLPILGVRCERLQDIDSADVPREGIGWDKCDREIFPYPVEYFGHSWDLMYGVEYPFAEDHWCRRIQFEPLKGGRKCQS